MQTVDKDPGSEVRPISRDAVLAQLPALIIAVPEAQDDDGEGIIANILMSADPLEAGNLGGLPEAEDMIGKRLRIEKLTRRESTQEDTWTPWYFVVEGTIKPSGEPFVFGTSAKSIVAQLAAMYALGQLPALVEVVKAEKDTKKGHRPLALRRPDGL